MTSCPYCNGTGVPPGGLGIECGFCLGTGKERPIWPSNRKTPYTSKGLSRLKCVRCGAQWQICSDGNIYRPLCRDCDIALNKLVLEWVNHPRIQELLAEYSL